MNYKNLLLILLFLTSCTVQSTQYSENIFSNRGFVLLYDESLIEKKLLRKPLDDRSLEIVHNTLSKGTKVRIINLLNNKSTNAIVKTKNKNLFFYNSIFSKRIFDELDISLKEPYVEISKIRENKTLDFCHTLNGSSLALPRIVAAILENNQTDSGIKIPQCLWDYTGFKLIS